MGIDSTENYWLSCDKPNCCETFEPSHLQTDSEQSVVRWAKEDGWTEQIGKWFCPKHTPKKGKHDAT
jgi:hypothetical protein